MGLSEIAAGVEVTTEQRDRGVATVDGTDRSVRERLADVDDELPCSAGEADALLEAYAEGASVGRAAAVAGLPETTAAKTLHLLGEPIDPLPPTARRVLEDWLDGEIARSEAVALANVGEREFALGAYVATHEPIPDVDGVVADRLALEEPGDPLADARSDLDEWL